MTAGSKLKRVAVPLLEIALVVAVGVLTWSNYTLRTRVQHSHPVEMPFSIGDHLGRVAVVDAQGVRRDLDLSSGRTLVAILNPTCSACAVTLSEIGKNRNVPAVILASRGSQGLPALASQFQLAGRTFTIAEPANSRLWERFIVNPQLFIVDRGKVVRTCGNVTECR